MDRVEFYHKGHMISANGSAIRFGLGDVLSVNGHPYKVMHPPIFHIDVGGLGRVVQRVVLKEYKP